MQSPARARSIAACLAAVLAAAAPASAAVVTNSPTLPLLGVPYVSAVGAGCFPAAGVCISAGSLTLTSLQSSSFVPAGQDIVTSARFDGTLTTLAAVPIGLVQLLGTAEQLVLGRTTPTEIGSWTTELVALSLTGTLLGGTLTLALDPAHSSTGITSITPVAGAEGRFVIDSFFDVFVELSLDGPVPLTTTRGPIRAEATEIPEPPGIALLAAAGLMLAFATMRRGVRTG